MYLPYGVNQHGELVYIGQAPRGRTTLTCPYCGGLLLAKKGAVKVAHFAHAGETCYASQRDQDAIALPVFDRFDLHLPGKTWEALQVAHHDPRGLSYEQRFLLDKAGLIFHNSYLRNGRGGYELTNKGQVPFGGLSLQKFIQFQEPLIEAKHNELQRTALFVQTRRSDEFLTRLADLQLYRAQWRRVLSCRLYFLKINNAQVDNLYKIGVTTRPIEERIAEITHELAPLLGMVQAEVVDTWEHRGNVELYFKFRYQADKYPLGNLTEYFVFPDIKPILSYDLRRMKPKELTDLEKEVLAGLPSALERRIAAEQAATIEAERRAQRQHAIKEGMRQAAQQGKHVGRPAGKLSNEEFFSRPKNTLIRKLLQQGKSVRGAAKEAEASTSTVWEVKRRMGEQAF